MGPTSLNIYTVIGLHPDTDWSDGLRAATFVHFVRAGTPTLAAREAKRQMTTSYPEDPGNPDDIMIVAVFEGRHEDRYEQSLDTEEYERDYEQEMSQ